MGKSPIEIIAFAIILGIALVTQSITAQNTSLLAHRDGCHRWHSCPSDNGSYVCGDLGRDDECPKKSKDKKEDSKKSDKSKSKSKKDKSKNDSGKNTPKTDKSQSKIDVKTTTNATLISSPVLPAPTTSEGIELSGPVTYVVDGDTLDISGGVRIRLALVNTPEVGQQVF
jgi:hypothetical protein